MWRSVSYAATGGRLDVMAGADGSAGPGARPQWRGGVALSFAGAQRDYVEQVAAALTARGVRCFYDADEEIELWGKYLAEELPAIYGEQAAAFVIFVPAEYAARGWTRLERRAALARAVRERREYVLPARFDNTPLPGPLSDMVAVDLPGRPPEQFAAMIADKLAALGIRPSPPQGGVGWVQAGGGRAGGAAAPRMAERAAIEGQFTYQDFDLLIEPGPPGSYRARGPGEPAPGDFSGRSWGLEGKNSSLKVGLGPPPYPRGRPARKRAAERLWRQAVRRGIPRRAEGRVAAQPQPDPRAAGGTAAAASPAFRTW